MNEDLIPLELPEDFKIFEAKKDEYSPFINIIFLKQTDCLKTSPLIALNKRNV